MTVKIVTTPAEMSAWTQAQRRAGARIALVPTMGFLHAGHVALLHEARRRADRVVMSLFVNPTQFGPGEDLEKYPRDFDGDVAKAEAVGTDVVFAPPAAAMYPPGHQTHVDVTQLSQGLCGDRRPKHFQGVATVVCKLFNIVQPHTAVFGEKDYQQLMVIRRMVVDLNLDIDIVGVPTLREPDGLAMSSRNSYLSPDQRRRATAIHQGLQAVRQAVHDGESDSARLVATAAAIIGPQVDRIDYIEIRAADALQPLGRVDGPAVMLVAAFVGPARLIDNLRIRDV